MRPLLVLLLVLAAIGALLFAVFRIDSGAPKGPEVGPNAVQEQGSRPTKPVELAGSNKPADRTATKPAEDRAVAGGNNAVALDNRLTGLVRNPQGAPVVGAEVILTTLNASEMFFVDDAAKIDLTREPRVRTDGDGRYAFVGVQPRSRYTLVLTHPDYARKEEPTVPIAETGASEMPPITMAPGATLSGRVRNEADDLVAGAELHLEHISYMGLNIVAPDRVSTTSDAQGGYEFKNVARGARYLIVSAPGYATTQVSNLNFEKEEVVVRDIKLKVAEGICGKVVAGGGAGVEGAIVIAVGISSTQQTGRAQVLTDANGQFCFDNLAPGPYNIIASAKGYRMLTRSNRVDTNTSNHVIEMMKEATVTGRVTEKGSGAPVTAFTVRVRVSYGPGVPTAPFNEDVWPQQNPSGDFVIEGVPPGDLVIEAFAPGYAPGFSAPFTVLQGQPVTGVNIQLGHGGTISGRVVDAEGKPVPRALVTSRDNEWADDAFTEAMGTTYPTNTTSAQVRTGADGRFTLQYLNPETYQVTVDAAGFTSFAQRDLRVNEGVDTAVGDIKLGRGGIVRGTLFDASGKPLSGGTVTLRIAGGDTPREYTTRSGADGRYQIANAAPGRYVIGAMRPGGDGNPFTQFADQAGSELSVTISEGQTTTQDLHLSE